MTALCLVLLLSCTPTALLDFAVQKWKADPAVRVEDTYKWLFQATRGGEHAAPDRNSAKQWLDSEWSSLAAPIDKEPVWEPLCPGGEIGRVNLRAFKNAGGKEDDILEAFIISSLEYRATVREFTAAWLELGKRLKKKPVGNVSLSDWTKLDAEMQSKGYPAIHHSDIYDRERRPAYRIVTKSESQKLTSKLTRSARSLFGRRLRLCRGVKYHFHRDEDISRY